MSFFAALQQRFSEIFASAGNILEVGSQDINGTVRGFFPSDTNYLGIDLGIAKCVDWVVPGELIELPDHWADIVISTECFEHCKDWDKVFINMIRILKPGGLCILTCASGERAAHGTIDSDEADSPFTSNYYKNLGPDSIAEKIRLGAYFKQHAFEVNTIDNDLYFWGIRTCSSILESDSYWEDPISRLVRCQGQLGQAATRHAKLSQELIQAKAQADQAKAQADQAKAQADQAKAQADQAKAQADQAKAELTSMRKSKFWALTQPIRKTLDLLRSIFR